MSGKKALAVADQFFLSKNKTEPSQYKSHTVHYGWVVRPLAKDEGQGLPAKQLNWQAGARDVESTRGTAPRATGQEIIDEVLLTVMRAPNTYTREDIVEISGHGGIAALKNIFQAVVDLGVRPAEPGEFTKRAFLNGRIDLAQAEAVLDIIQAKTDAFLRVSANQLKGDLSLELERIREFLMGTYTEMEAIVNFPEDEIETPARESFLKNIQMAQVRIDKLLASGQQGKILREGIKIVLCGKPNVGKSSVLNALLKQPRAIVSEIAGTTRDTIEETAQIQGIAFQLVDTAGILEPRDFIEQEAVKRSQMFIEQADLLILVIDASEPLSPEDVHLLERLKSRRAIIVLNKCDLGVKVEEGSLKQEFSQPIVRISALKKIALEELEKAMVDCVLQGISLDTDAVLVSNLRHLHSLRECSSALALAREAMNNVSMEFVCEELKMGIHELDTITGRNIDQDLLDKIFSEFCIGK